MEKYSVKQQTVLIVEDNECLREIMCHFLMPDFNILNAGTAEEGIRIINSSSNIDLLITDFDLRSDLDGLDVSLAMKEKYKQCNKPIILLTGSDASTPRIKSLLSMSNTHLVRKASQGNQLEQQILSIFPFISNSSL